MVQKLTGLHLVRLHSLIPPARAPIRLDNVVQPCKMFRLLSTRRWIHALVVPVDGSFALGSLIGRGCMIIRCTIMDLGTGLRE